MLRKGSFTQLLSGAWRRMGMPPEIAGPGWWGWLFKVPWLVLPANARSVRKATASMGGRWSRWLVGKAIITGVWPSCVMWVLNSAGD